MKMHNFVWKFLCTVHKFKLINSFNWTLLNSEPPAYIPQNSLNCAPFHRPGKDNIHFRINAGYLPRTLSFFRNTRLSVFFVLFLDNESLFNYFNFKGKGLKRTMSSHLTNKFKANSIIMLKNQTNQWTALTDQHCFFLFFSLSLSLPPFIFITSIKTRPWQWQIRTTVFLQTNDLTYRAPSGQLAELIHAIKHRTVLPDVDWKQNENQS